MSRSIIFLAAAGLFLATLDFLSLTYDSLVLREDWAYPQSDTDSACYNTNSNVLRTHDRGQIKLNITILFYASAKN